MTRHSLCPHVGVLALTIDLYRDMPDLLSRMAGFAEELLNTLRPTVEVSYSGVCDTRQMVDAAVAEMEHAGVDLLLVLPLTYAPSHIVLPAILRTHLPVAIINTQILYTFASDLHDMVLDENQALPGVQDLANVLVRHQVPFQVITGHYKDPAFVGELRAWCKAAQVAQFVRQMRVGLVGHPMDGMGDFAIDLTALLAQIGVEVQHISPGEVARLAADAPAHEIEQQMAADRAAFQVVEPLPEDEHQAASRLEWALRQVVRRHGLHGLAVHFLTVDEDGRFEALPLMAASKLMADGYGYGGEGDVACAVAMATMVRLAGAAGFFEGWAMDFGREAIVFTHMGEGNYGLARQDRPIRLVRYPFPMKVPKPPVNLVFDFQPGEATVVNLTTSRAGQLKFTVTEGQVLDFASVRAVPMPQGAFKPDAPLQEFLERYFLVGASHHSALAYGRWAGAVTRVASLLGVDCERV